MSTPAVAAGPAPQTIKDLLLPGTDLPPELTRAVGEVAKGGGISDVLTRLTPIGLDILGSRIGALLSEMLNVDIGTIVGGALTKNQEIANALRDTAAQPGSEAVVPLADQTLGSSYSHAVDIVVDNATLLGVTFDIALDAILEGALVVVRDGRMVAVRAGRAHLSGSLSCGGALIAAREIDLDIPAALRLPAATAAGAGAVITGVAGPAIPASPPQGTAVAGLAPPAQVALPMPMPVPTQPAVPASVRPPVGQITNGWRFTSSGTWEPVTQHQPGDIVNGLRLNAAGTEWEPLPPR